MILALSLAGAMSIYNTLIGARWTCTLGTVRYFAEYTVTPGNTMHGHLYSKDSSEDVYFGYDVKQKRFWSVNADSAGETESQMSSDGWTFLGTLSSGGAHSKTTNTYTIYSARHWHVRARGSVGGQAYDVNANCLRQ